jgi:hypothetical protein
VLRYAPTVLRYAPPVPRYAQAELYYAPDAIPSRRKAITAPSQKSHHRDPSSHHVVVTFIGSGHEKPERLPIAGRLWMISHP